jgi:short-subunit dehydrogenase
MKLAHSRLTRRYSAALITGASSGIGAAFAEQIAADTKLLITGRDSEILRVTAERLGGEGREVEWVAADLTTAAGRDTVVERAEAMGVDLFIANAGMGTLGPFLENDPSREAAALELNVVAPVLMTRALLPGMLSRVKESSRRGPQGRAGLVILSSSLAYLPVPYLATYAASKAFDLVFAESLAEELRGEPIDVLALCPGPTRTAFGRRAGFSRASLPGAAAPETVAREALMALGRRQVLVTGRAEQAALSPVMIARQVLSGALGRAMRRVIARQERA